MPQASNLSGELSNVDFVDAQDGWAISDEDFGYLTGAPLTVEHTTDGGATWVPQHVYDNADLSGVDFISDTTGWVSVLRRFVERASGVDPGDELPYDYLRFKCTLKPGEYRVVVRALDVAGNPQCLIGHGVLKVVRHGAPVFRGPGWPAGLATDYSDYAARLSHDPQARRLLRLRVSLPDGRRMLLTSLAGKSAPDRSRRRPATTSAPAGTRSAPAGDALRRCRSGSWRRRRRRGSRRRTE